MNEPGWKEIKAYMDSFGIAALAINHLIFRDTGDAGFDMLRQEVQVGLSNLRQLVNQRAMEGKQNG